MSKFRGSITLSIFSLSTLSNYHYWQSPKTRYWRLVRPYQTGIPPARLLALVWAHNFDLHNSSLTHADKKNYNQTNCLHLPAILFNFILILRISSLLFRNFTLLCAKTLFQRCASLLQLLLIFFTIEFFHTIVKHIVNHVIILLFGIYFLVRSPCFVNRIHTGNSLFCYHRWTDFFQICLK